MLHYSVGRGKDLVLIHGWLASDKAWTPLVEALQDTYRLHLICLPGHERGHDNTMGHTTGNNKTGRVSLQHPRAVCEAIAEVTPAGAVWVGWSLGARLALLATQVLANRTPQEINQPTPSKLVCVAMGVNFIASKQWRDGVPRIQFNAFSKLFRSSPRLAMRRFYNLSLLGDNYDDETKAYFEKHFGSWDDALDVGELTAGLDLLARDDIGVTQITQPALFIAGKDDRVVSPDNVRQSAQQLGAEYKEIAHAGHGVCASRPDEVAQLIKQFVN